MKKTLSLLLAFVMLISASSIALTASAGVVEYDETLSNSGTWVEGSITDSNTEDYYRIVLPSDGEVTIKFMYYMNYCYFYLYNDDLSEKIAGGTYSGGTSSSPGSEKIIKSLSKGTYYVEISQYTYSNNNTGKYKLSETFSSYGTNDTEPNDFDHAMSLSESKVITGALTYSDEVDWYKIYVPTDCTVTVTFKYYYEYGEFYLYNSDLTEKLAGGYYSGGTSSSPDTATSDPVSLSKGTYYIKVCKYSYSSDNKGKYTIKWNMNISVSKPSNFKRSSSNTSSIKLSWKKVSGATGYQIQRLSGDTWKTVKTITSNSTTSYKVSNLSSGKTYKFRIRAYKTVNSKNYYSSYTGTLITATKPVSTSISSISSPKSKQIKIKWKKVSNCTGYQIQYSTKKDFSNAKTVTVKGSSSASKTISKLKSKKKYYVRVRAYKTADGTKYYSSWSKTKTVTTKK